MEGPFLSCLHKRSGRGPKQKKKNRRKKGKRKNLGLFAAAAGLVEELLFTFLA